MSKLTLMTAMLSAFAPELPRPKRPKSDWKHSDERVERAKLKRERKNKKRLSLGSHEYHKQTDS